MAKKPDKKDKKKVAPAKKKPAPKAVKKAAPKKQAKPAPKKAAPKKAAAPPKGKAAAPAAAAKKAAAPAGKKAAPAPAKAAAPAAAPAAKAAKAAKPIPPKVTEKVAKAKKEDTRAAKAPPEPVEEIIETEEPEEDEGAEEIVLTDADGRRYCRVKDCDQISSVDGYCRFHYLLYWKKIQIRKKILSEGKLERYVEELTARYPDKFLDMLRKDLKNEKDFLNAIQELEIDESAGDNEFEEETQTYIDEVRGMNETTGGREEEDF